MLGGTDVGTTWLQGPDHIRRTIIKSIETDLPGIYAALCAQWGVSTDNLPYIDQFDSDEPLGGMGEQLGYVTMNMPSANSMTPVSIDDAIAEEFRVNYSCRLYTYVKTGADPEENEGGYARINRIRDMTAAAIRAAILFTPSFHSDDLELQHTTLVENYSDIMSVNGDRWIAAFYHEFDVKADERLVRPLLGHANTIIPTIQTME